jgi:peptidoglycan hydrolase-like protein with peptidoglycan-binding domain
MPFLLQRGGKNVPLEVQRWQYFLLRNKITQSGIIDAQFGAKTEEATKIFQVQHSLKVTGRLDEATLVVAQGLGYTVSRMVTTMTRGAKIIRLVRIIYQAQRMRIGMLHSAASSSSSCLSPIAGTRTKL